jgi:outer membrane receptor protein involved in Fe transport
MLAFSLVVMVLLGPPHAALAGTTGKVAGDVVDMKGEPVPGVTVVLGGTRLGAYTDTQGHYNIINIPPGTYELRFSHVTYHALTVTGVQVSADQTTRQDMRMQETAVQLQTIEVRAARPIVDVQLTSTRATVTTEEINALPVQELADVVNLQAGVVEGHIRGGRAGEVDYQVDGVSVNNPFNNASTLRVDRHLLQEVQVISGVFDAEFGQAMSGVVNAVLKDGTESFRWNAEVSGGGFVFSGGSRRQVDDGFLPTAIRSAQFSASGPTPFPQTVFLASGRRYAFDDYLRGVRRFVPTDSADFALKMFTPTGNGEEVALGYTREWSGLVKLSNRSIPGVGLSYQAIFNDWNGRRSNYAYRFNPDGLSKQKQFSIAHGIDLIHTLSPETYYKLTFRQNYLRYEDFVYEDVFDLRYDDAGPALGDQTYELGAVVQGVDFTRYRQGTNLYLMSGSYTSQIRSDHLIKLGVNLEVPAIEFGTPGHLVYTTVSGRQALVRHIDDPPDYPGVNRYEPIIASAYVQDQMEWKDLTIRTGLRFEYFDARSELPGDLANPANSIEGVPGAGPKPTDPKSSVAPRLGVAFPIGDRGGVHFAYGHFYQFPALGEIFANADYAILDDLQAGGVTYGVLGNPDVNPEKTVQYEIGYKHAVSEDLGLDLNVFYKDIRDLLGVEFVSTYNNAEYARLTNVDFGNVIGFTFAFDHRKLGPVSASMDYTWQLAEGNASDPRETATRAEAGEDPRPRLVPLNWDQRHTFNMSLLLIGIPDLSLSVVLRTSSGQPYTPIIESGFGSGLGTNSGRKPTGTVVDLRAERTFATRGVNLGLFGRITNLLDTRYFNGAVFNSTGSPYYSRFPEADKNSLGDPSRFYQPRRIEIGLKVEPRQSEEQAE